MTPIDLNLAASQSSAADSGHTGAFTVNTGGGKTSQTVWIVLGAVAVIGLVVWAKISK